MSKQAAKAPCPSTAKAGRPSRSTAKAGRHCSFTTRAGRPCRAWAVRGSEPPACSSHLSASLRDGVQEQACSSHLRASLRDDVQEQACSSHLRSNPGKDAGGQAWVDDLLSAAGEDTLEAGFYDQTLSDEELADLIAYAAELSLDDEIACARIAVRRTLEFLKDRPGSLSEAEYLRAAGLVFQGARTIARLLREQQALTGGAGDRVQAIFDAALDGLSEEWGIEL